ncbi:TPA: hypothetical protein OMT82_000419 [Enterobacter cloacae]|nr:hypothetical protein [Enterobacter cloacae]HCR0905067.1 hypothetical protein [Enterobacter cloacae]
MIGILIELIKSASSFFTKKQEVQQDKDELEVEKAKDNNNTNREEIRKGFGWRNFLGYVCTFILVYSYVIVPLLDYFGIVVFQLPLGDIVKIILLLVGGN